MKNLKNILKFNKAFTLVEFAVALAISAFLIVIVYTMLLTAQQTFKELYDASRNSNNIRYFEDSIRESFCYLKGTPTIKSGTTFLSASRSVGSTTLTDVYTVSGSACLIGPSSAKANTLADLKNNSGLDSNSTKAAPTYYTLNKTSGGVTTKVLSNIRNIYINYESYSGTGKGGYGRLRVGVIYDEILSTGKSDIVRPKRKVFCFTSKG